MKKAAMGDVLRMSAEELAAACDEVLEQFEAGEVQRLEVTKGGQVVAVMIPAMAGPSNVGDLHGFMRGSILIPPDVDLTAPVLDEEPDAARGILHR